MTTTILHVVEYKKQSILFIFSVGKVFQKVDAQIRTLPDLIPQQLPLLTLTLISFSEFFFFPWTRNSDHGQKGENWKKRPVLGNYWLPTKRQHFDSWTHCSFCVPTPKALRSCDLSSATLAIYLLTVKKDLLLLLLHFPKDHGRKLGSECKNYWYFHGIHLFFQTSADVLLLMENIAL